MFGTCLSVQVLIANVVMPMQDVMPMGCKQLAARKVGGEALSSHLRSQLCRNFGGFAFVNIFLLAPTGALVLMMVYYTYIYQPTFSDFHSVH